MYDVFLLRQWAPLCGFEQPVLARFTRVHPLPPQAGPTALAVEQMQTIAGASSAAFPHQYQRVSMVSLEKSIV